MAPPHRRMLPLLRTSLPSLVQTGSTIACVYQKIVAYLLGQFDQIFIELIPRASNSQADALARLATSEEAAELSEISITKIVAPSTLDYMVAQMDTNSDNWMTHIIEYLVRGTLPQDSTKASRPRIRAAHYT
ncbi:hypothetical protein ACS0TY_026234 [Phlomoides rotata]